MPNLAPVVGGGSVIGTRLYSNLVTFDEIVRLSYYAYDSDGEVTKFRLDDGNAAESSGHFTIDGVRQAAGASFEVSAADIGKVRFVGGSVASSDIVRLAVFDGQDWSNELEWTIVTENTAPVVTAVDIVVGRNQTVSAYGGIGISDAEGDPIAKFQFWDANAALDSGHFTVNGVVQAANQAITIDTSSNAQISYVAGSALSAETLWVRLYDGAEWGTWQSWTAAASDLPPVVSASNAAIGWGLSVAAAQLFGVSDADGDAITQYELWDEGAGGGYFAVGGVRQAAGQAIAVSASDLGDTRYVAGPGAGAEILWVRANDGLEWSAWKSWAMTTQGSPPIAQAPSRGVHIAQEVALSSLFSVSDPDGSAITRYEFWDSGPDAGGGYFKLAGSAQSAQQAITVTLADLAQATYVGGSKPGAETLWVRANDGNGYGPWASWEMTTGNALPAIAAADARIHLNHARAGSALFSVADADGDAVSRYRFWDSGAQNDSGYFRLAGVRQSAGAAIEVDATNLPQLDYVGGTRADSETVWVQAFDGSGWSDWKSWSMTSGNAAPEVQAADHYVLLQHYWPITDLVHVTDADQDRITEYEFWDSGADAGSGYLQFNGAQQAAKQAIPVMAPFVSQVSYIAGTSLGPETVWARAFDGEQWSEWKSWTMETVASLPAGASSASFTLSSGAFAARADFSYVIDYFSLNHLPIVTTIPATVFDRHTIPLSGLFTVSDADGDAITRLEFSVSAGHLNVDGVAATATVNIAPDSAGSISYTASQSTGLTSIAIRAFDGTAWSQWQNANITVVPNHAPTIAMIGVSSSWLSSPIRYAGFSVSWSGAGRASEWSQGTVILPYQSRSLAINQLFLVTDADGDPITGYQAYDARSADGSGYFTIDGVAQNAGEIISISGADIPKFGYVVGQRGEPERIWVRVTDGYDWSDWQNFTVNAANAAPVMHAGDATVGRNQAVGTGSLFSATDGNGDPLTQYELWDSGAGTSSGHFTVNGVSQAASQSIAISAASLAQTHYVGGDAPGSETVWVRAYDGSEWSDWKSWTMSTQGGAPVVSAADRVLDIRQSVAASTLFSVSDGDGDEITQYEFWDSGPASGSGHFTVNGIAQSAQQSIPVGAGDLAQVAYSGGSANSAETVWVRADDGSGWSDWKGWNMTTQALPAGSGAGLVGSSALPGGGDDTSKFTGLLA